MKGFKRAISLLVIMLLIITSISPYINTYAAPRKTQSLTPGKFTNTTYKLKSGIKSMPQTMQYDLQPMDLPDLLGKNPNIKKVGSKVTGIKIEPEAIDPAGITMKDLKYPVDSNYLVLTKDVKSFSPKAGEIYLDNSGQRAVKVLGGPMQDTTTGNKVLPVEKAGLEQVFESYKIPEQRVALNKANVSYVAPTTPDEDGESYINIEQTKEVNNVSLASAGSGPISFEDDCMVVTIKNLTIYEYPEPPKDEKDKEKEKQAGSTEYNENQETMESEEGYYDQKDEDVNSKDDKKEEEKKKNLDEDLKGVDEANSLSIKVKIEEGTIKIYKPRAFADVDIGLLEQEVKVGFESDIKSDVKLKGELKFNKVIETCLYGYNVEIPYGRLFIGVFLIMDAKGQVEVKARVVSEGKLEVGLKAEAIVFVPVYVGPYAEPTIESVNVGFSVDGEVEAKVALVPQVGLVICDKEILVFQLWIALKANAEFHIEGNAGADLNTLDVEGDIKGEGHLKLDAYAELLGYLWGYKYSFFYKEWNLYDNTWVFGQDVQGGGSTLEPLYGNVTLRADAYNDTIEGNVTYFDHSAKKYLSLGQISFPDGYQGNELTLEIKDKNGNIENIKVQTDWNGYFEITKDITPFHKIKAKLNTTITDASGAKRNLICSSSTVEPDIPYRSTKYTVDAFNNVVTGIVASSYDSDYTGSLLIQKKDKDGNITKYQAEAVDGKYNYKVGLVGGDEVSIHIPFEGAIFPKQPAYKKASLDSLKLYVKKDATAGTLSGSIINMVQGGQGAYKGNVTISSISPAGGGGEVYYNEPVETYPKEPAASNTGSNIKLPGIKLPEIPDAFKPKALEILSSTFVAPLKSIGYVVSIKHDGITKSIVFDPFKKAREIAKTPVQEAVTNPVQDKIDSIVNPAQLWTGVWETVQFGTLVLQQNGQQVTGVFDGGVMNYNVKAVAKGNTLQGTITNKGKTTSFEASLSADGKTISGKSSLGSVKTKALSFSGNKRNLSPSSSIFTGKSKQSWSGIWFSDYGTMILEQQGSIVKGTVGDEEYPISGKIVGNKLVGTYFVDDVEYQVEFLLEPGTKSLSGKMKLESELEWDDWNMSFGK